MVKDELYDKVVEVSWVSNKVMVIVLVLVIGILGRCVESYL